MGRWPIKNIKSLNESTQYLVHLYIFPICLSEYSPGFLEASPAEESYLTLSNLNTRNTMKKLEFLYMLLSLNKKFTIAKVDFLKIKSFTTHTDFLSRDLKSLRPFIHEKTPVKLLQPVVIVPCYFGIPCICVH